MQIFPSGLGQGRVGADDVANHLPGGEIEGSVRSRPHGERNGALGAEADAAGGRFLTRADSDGLREEIDADGFLAHLEFAIATQAAGVFQEARPLK